MKLGLFFTSCFSHHPFCPFQIGLPYLAVFVYGNPENGVCFCFAVVLENHEVTDDDVEPSLKRSRIEINCQDPSIKVGVDHFVEAGF